MRAAALALVLAAAPAAADEVDVYARCAFDGAVWEIGHRTNMFQTPVARRVEGGTAGDWLRMRVPRHSGLMTSPEVVAHWRDGDRIVMLTYPPAAPAPVRGVASWVEVGTTVTASGQASAACDILRPHEDPGVGVIHAEPPEAPGNMVIARCTFGGEAVEISIDAERPYNHFWRIDDRFGRANSLLGQEATARPDRAFLFDDGDRAILLSHGADGGAVRVAARVTPEAAHHGMADTGTCEVLP